MFPAWRRRTASPTFALPNPPTNSVCSPLRQRLFLRCGFLPKELLPPACSPPSPTTTACHPSWLRAHPRCWGAVQPHSAVLGAASVPLLIAMLHRLLHTAAAALHPGCSFALLRCLEVPWVSPDGWDCRDWVSPLRAASSSSSSTGRVCLFGV